MSSVGPRPIPQNEPVSKQRRGNDYIAPKLPKPPEFPKVVPGEDPIMDDQGATPKKISDIITQVTVAMARARVGLGMTN